MHLLFLPPLFFTPNFFTPTIFTPTLVKWKFFRFIENSSPANVPIHDFIGKITTFFEKVGKWKIFRFVGKSSLTANIPIDQILEEFPPFANVPIHLILLENFPLSPFGLKIGTLTAPDKQSSGIFVKVGKWKIFRFTGKFSSTANIKFLEENLPIFPNWKILYLHSV